MSAITLTFNNSAALRALSGLGAAGDRATVRALKRTTTSVRALMASLVAKDAGVSVATVKKAMDVTVAADGSQAAVRISGARLPLVTFRATGPNPSRGRGRAVTATVEGQRRTYRDAFLATMGSGHTGVFKRAQTLARKSRGAWSRNLPIVQLFGPSLPKVFAKFLPEGAQRAEEQMAKNLEHELAFELSKLKE